MIAAIGPGNPCLWKHKPGSIIATSPDPSPNCYAQVMAPEDGFHQYWICRRLETNTIEIVDEREMHIITDAEYGHIMKWINGYGTMTSYKGNAEGDSYLHGMDILNIDRRGTILHPEAYANTPNWKSKPISPPDGITARHIGNEAANPILVESIIATRIGQ